MIKISELQELYDCRNLLREIVMRGGYLFPETFADARLQEEGTSVSDHDKWIFNVIRVLHLGKKGDGNYGES